MDDGKYEDNTAESNELEAATPVGRKDLNTGETSKTPAQQPPAANCLPK